MRHGDKINNLGRTTAHRKALMKNLACQLIEHKRINTTLAKAKSLRVFVEPIITKSKSDTTHNRRLAFDKLQDKKAVQELFSVVSDKVAGRPGGYTRIIKLAPRFGDAADMAMIELVDFNTIYVKGDKAAAKKTRRSSRRSSGKTKETTLEETSAVTEEKAVKGDDLKKIEGIGPKIAEALNHAGVTSFAALTQKSADEVKEILKAAEGNFSMADPTTWAEQAALAAAGKWEELKTLQEELKGGKKAE